MTIHDYDSTPWPVEAMREHLRTAHGNDATLPDDDLPTAHARAHKSESGIGDRDPMPQEVAAIVMKLVNETINDPEYVNSRGEPMPWNVTEFSHLHDYVDANMYLIEADAHFGGDGGWSFRDGDEDGFKKAVDRANAVTDIVTEQLTARVEGLNRFMEWKTSECSARIIQADWLRDRSFIVNWTDYMVQEESCRFQTLSEAVACLAALIHCGEDAWRSGFNEGMADVIHDFFGKAVS